MCIGKEVRLPACRKKNVQRLEHVERRISRGQALFLANTSVSLLTSGTREGSSSRQSYMFFSQLFCVLATIPNLNCFHVGTLAKLFKFSTHHSDSILHGKFPSGVPSKRRTMSGERAGLLQLISHHTSSLCLSDSGFSAPCVSACMHQSLSPSRGSKGLG